MPCILGLPQLWGFTLHLSNLLLGPKKTLIDGGQRMWWLELFTKTKKAYPLKSLLWIFEFGHQATVSKLGVKSGFRV
jgi:hypothetical protein